MFDLSVEAFVYGIAAGAAVAFVLWATIGVARFIFSIFRSA